MNWAYAYALLPLGLIYGGLVGYFNHRLIIHSWNKVNPKGNLQREKQKVTGYFVLHYLIDAAALFLVCRYTALLIGAGLGMLIVQKTIVVRQLMAGKGVKK